MRYKFARMSRQTIKGITTPHGFRAAGGGCGIKASGAADLALIVADRPCAAAGVFTRSRTRSAPVLVGQRHLGATGGIARAIVCNSGCANASTGRQGKADAVQMCRDAAEQIGCDYHQVLPCSTGLIGVPLPMQKISRGIAVLASRLGRGSRADAQTARGILTTDLVTKTAYRAVRLGRRPGKLIHLAAVAKGSGMIAPNMATMLAFITTDAPITPAALKLALRSAVGASFNRISVDQHTSPSDTVLALASGAAGNPKITRGGANFTAFTDALGDLCDDLAYQIVNDGEGATKVFCVHVVNAKSVRDADRIGKAVVESPLVKTAVHGGDPNWGRITTAAGYSGAAIRPEKLSLHIGDQCVYERGQPVPIGRAAARKLARIMSDQKITFRLDIGLGKAETRWLGCDLSRQYITINADYTT